jgi:hypothetical protein
VSVTDQTNRTIPAVGEVAVDLYRDIHKGIRTRLFEVTSAAGRTDPGSIADRGVLAGAVHDLVLLLVTHAEHEDSAVQPVIERELPVLADQVARDHHTLDARMIGLREMAVAVADPAVHACRPALHRLYLELASFTGAYLAHQDLEERVVMPALEAAVGPKEALAVHLSIVGAIPPQEMAASLAFMLPAMNLDDRADMLGGMRAAAPEEAFDGVLALAGSVLAPEDRDALATRLGVAAPRPHY